MPNVSHEVNCTVVRKDDFIFILQTIVNLAGIFMHITVLSLLMYGRIWKKHKFFVVFIVQASVDLVACFVFFFYNVEILSQRILIHNMILRRITWMVDNGTFLVAQCIYIFVAVHRFRSVNVKHFQEFSISALLKQLFALIISGLMIEIIFHILFEPDLFVHPCRTTLLFTDNFMFDLSYSTLMIMKAVYFGVADYFTISVSLFLYGFIFVKLFLNKDMRKAHFEIATVSCSLVLLQLAVALLWQSHPRLLPLIFSLNYSMSSVLLLCLKPVKQSFRLMFVKNQVVTQIIDMSSFNKT